MFRFFCCCIRYFFTWFSCFFCFFLLLMGRKYLQKAFLTYTFQNQKFTQPSLSVPKCFILYIFNFGSIILLALWIYLFFFIYFVIIFLRREKASLQHEIEEKEEMIRQRNGEIQVHCHVISVLYETCYLSNIIMAILLFVYRIYRVNLKKLNWNIKN